MHKITESKHVFHFSFENCLFRKKVTDDDQKSVQSSDYVHNGNLFIILMFLA